MKHFFIVNPAAGRGNKVDFFVDLIRKIGKSRSLDYELYMTEGIGDARRYVSEMCKVADQAEKLRFYACGGDGTINEVVNGAVGFDGAEVATIPIGTGNDFVRNFGSEESFFDLENQIASEAVACDLMTVNDRYCVNMVNIGFDCEVVARTARIKRNPLIPGKLAYIFGVIGEFVRQRGVSFRCTIDGICQGERKLLISLFANGGFCGGGFRAAPYAELTDGKMDVCFIRLVKRLQFIKLIGSYKKGLHMLRNDCDDFFEYYKCSDVLLEFDKPQRVCVDGEISEYRSLHMGVVRNAIRFVLPTNAKMQYEAVPASPFVKVLG